MYRPRRLLMLLAVTVFGVGGCRASDLVTPRASLAAPSHPSRNCLPVDPTEESDCAPPGLEAGGDLTVDPSVFWPTDFAVTFPFQGTGYIGEAVVQTPIGFSGTQTYSFAGVSIWGETCYGEIYLSVNEAVLLKALMETPIQNSIVLGCY